MVVYDLICKKNHRFEGWFPSADGYEEQAVRKQISCPACGTTKVAKLPHACAVHTKGDSDRDRERTRNKDIERDRRQRPKVPPPPLTEADAKEMLLRVHHHVRENFEDVGPRFAEEARKAFYGKIKKRPIYGTATPSEREELDEDGIPHIILPKPELDS